MFPFCDLQRQYAAYKDEIDTALETVLGEASFIQGEQVTLLEHELAQYVGVRGCVTCGSGTDALMLALMALRIGPGHEVVTTPFSFFATAGAISIVGATPRFVDIQPDTYNVDPAAIEAAIGPDTRAIMPVSLFGQPADMDEIRAIAARHGLPVIEDAAQSFGATYRGRFSCALSTIACTSFYPTKPLGCYGDGGAVFTDDASLAQRVRSLANHGQVSRNNHIRVGINSRLDTLQAAVLRVRLAHLDEELAERELIARRYTEALENTGSITLPVVREDRTSAWAQFSIQVEDRADFRRYLSDNGVPTAVYYEVPIYRQPVYEELEIEPSQFPVTEHTCPRIVSLPMSSHLAPEVQERVISTIAAYGRVTSS